MRTMAASRQGCDPVRPAIVEAEARARRGVGEPGYRPSSQLAQNIATCSWSARARASRSPARLSRPSASKLVRPRPAGTVRVRARIHLTMALDLVQSRRVLALRSVGWIWVVVFVLSSCTKPNPAVCCISEADCAGIGASGIRTCSDGLVCVENLCSELAGTCMLDRDCPVVQPYCSNASCVGCLSGDHCSVDTPICDGDSQACRGCARDEECQSGVCDPGEGRCSPEEFVVYASPNGSPSSNCERTAPCSIGQAFSVANAFRNTVKLAAGTYNASLTISTKRLVVHGFGATMTHASQNTLTILDTAHVTLLGLTIVNTATSPRRLGVLCESSDSLARPELVLDRVSIDTQGQSIHLNLVRARSIARSFVHCAPRAARSHWLLRTEGEFLLIGRCSMAAPAFLRLATPLSRSRIA